MMGGRVLLYKCKSVVEVYGSKDIERGEGGGGDGEGPSRKRQRGQRGQ